MKHRVFISYRRRNQDIAIQLQTILEAQGVVCWIDSHELQPSDQQWDEKIARAITECQVLLLLVTEGSMESPKQQKREISIAEKYQVPVLPVFVAGPEECRVFDYLLATTQYVDASKPPLIEKLEDAAGAVRRMLSALELARMKAQMRLPTPKPPTPTPMAEPAPPPTPGAPPEKPAGLKVALLYRRGVEPDERLLALLQQRLGARGHSVFVDRQLSVGAEWRRAIREKVENADAVIPLLSMFSVGSEMLEEEVRIATQHRQAEGRNPRILPLRVNYEGALPAGLGQCLEHLQYVLWRTPEDDEAVVQSLVASLEKPQPPPATVAMQAEMPVGAVPLTSPFYIVREGDRVFQAGIERRDSILLVKGARQMGKTSLIARGLRQAREKHYRVAITDLQTLNESDFRDLRSFYLALADHLVDQLELDASLADRWDERKAANVNFERFLRREVLKAAETPLVWALDEVDRLFACPYGTEVFGLFRSWHNARALDPASPWGQFSLVIGFATEASLFIRDVNMSPFNVGTNVTVRDFFPSEIVELNARYGSPMADFAPSEVAELNARHGSPIRDADGVARLMESVGGQPFLVRRILYALTVEETPFEKLLAEAATDHGIFGDHLRRFYISLHRDPELEAAMRDFIVHGRALSIDQFYRLRSAGLVVGEARQEAQVRCGIYRDYLRRHFA